MKESEAVTNSGLRAQGITKGFGGLTALSDVSFSLENGNVLGVIGPNGAGKTTLFNVITGFLKPDQGTLTYQGRNITQLKAHQIVELGIARTFQIVRPFRGMTVYENTLVAALSRRSHQARPRGMKPEEVALYALERVALVHRKAEKVESLPQGDLRRLEIARALATYPKLILLDEPFSGLGLKEMDKLSELIRDLHAENRSILIIEHKLKVLMSLAPRILVFDFGVLIADGTPEEIGSNEKVIRAYLGRKRNAVP